MKTTTLYDFTLTAGGAQIILADANMYKVLTATGDISVTRDGGATIKPLRAGRGERNVAFQRLILRDLSGAPNSGTILVGDSDFIDDTIVLSSAINVRPEVQSGSFIATAALVANTPDTVFTPASNVGGVILLSAFFNIYTASNAGAFAFVAHTAAPANISTGDHVLGGAQTSNSAGANVVSYGSLPSAQFIPAGKGLYFIGDAPSSGAVVPGNSYRSARYKLL